MADTDKLATNNLHVQGLCNRVSRFMTEALKSQSANLAYVNVHDLARVRSYVDACVRYQEWATRDPNPLDTPETHPTVFPITCPSQEEIGNVENESVRDWCIMCWILVKELAHSQSSRQSSGLIAHDTRRFKEMILKLRDFVDNYVEPTLPLDVPESSPQAPGVTPGRVGI